MKNDNILNYRICSKMNDHSVKVLSVVFTELREAFTFLSELKEPRYFVGVFDCEEFVDDMVVMGRHMFTCGTVDCYFQK